MEKGVGFSGWAWAAGCRPGDGKRERWTEGGDGHGEGRRAVMEGGERKEFEGGAGRGGGWGGGKGAGLVQNQNMITYYQRSPRLPKTKPR